MGGKYAYLLNNTSLSPPLSKTSTNCWVESLHLAPCHEHPNSHVSNMLSGFIRSAYR